MLHDVLFKVDTVLYRKSRARTVNRKKKYTCTLYENDIIQSPAVYIIMTFLAHIFSRSKSKLLPSDFLIFLFFQ